MDEILLYFAVKYEGDWDKIYSAINQKERVSEEDLEKVKEVGYNYITLLSDEYPTRLKTIYKPPFVLFYKGDISLANSNKKAIGVVGSRENSDYGKRTTQKLVKELVNNDCVIVSGLAKGIDSVAHLTCLENKGQTIAVLGNGILVNYPKENENLQREIGEKGLIVSEYPDYLEASKDNFPKRNRIVAGLSDAILLTEAKPKSGAMITVSRALEMGKEVFCVPNIIDNESGCNKLIKEGAKLVESASDILNEL